MRRWRLPSAKRLRLPSSASGDETRSSDDTSEVLRASGWPLWFCMAGPRLRPGVPERSAAPRELVNRFEASNSTATSRSQIV